MKQRTRIEIELSETVVYSRRNERFETMCSQCRCLVEMATPQIAAIVTRSTERTIFRYIEAGSLHFVENDRVLVCMRSLSKHLSEPSSPLGLRFLK